MRGELDFAGALDARVALLRGLDAAVIDRCHAGRVVIMAGARPLIRTMKAHALFSFPKASPCPPTGWWPRSALAAPHAARAGEDLPGRLETRLMQDMACRRIADELRGVEAPDAQALAALWQIGSTSPAAA